MGLTFAQKLDSLSYRPLITVELSPPKGTDISRIVQIAKQLKGRVDAINVPDCQRSVLKMSSMVASKIIQDEVGIETVWQLTCRDRNMIALQADLIGASAMGLKNILALTGDPVQVGDQREVAKQVFHLEAVRLLDLLNALNQGLDATGRALPRGGTEFTVGAALNPFRLSNHAQKMRLCQKLERQVSFFQTQPVYTVDVVERMTEILAEAAAQVGRPVPKLMIGLIPPRNADAARLMNQSVSGITIPPDFIDLLERSENPLQESFRYCAEVVSQLGGLCDGFHFMPVGMESQAAALLDHCFTQVS